MSKLERRFPKKRILITGATSGFGEALAYALAERGWNIAVSGLDLAEIKRTVDAVNQRGGKGVGLELEVRDKGQWQAARNTLCRDWGGIDILVNNAGVADANKMVDMTDDAWEKMLSINLDGVINGCRTWVPDLQAQQAGCILNVASIAGLLSMPEMANYNVSKAGVISLSETLFTELSGANIGVTVLCPSGFKSSLLDNALREGRDASQSVTGRLVKQDFDKAVYTSEIIAAYAIRAMEKGVLYSIPQPLYRFAWAIKRLVPHAFYRLVGWMYRHRIGLFAN
jgi:NADP-dependent 3-hydroxy acid dehydrogenase YdfG